MAKKNPAGWGLLFTLLIASSLGNPIAAQVAPTCSEDEKSHQFDFWIGEWDVYSQEQLAGTNSIRPILGGCVLQEI
jgi:hypothetical protein